MTDQQSGENGAEEREALKARDRIMHELANINAALRHAAGVLELFANVPGPTVDAATRLQLDQLAVMMQSAQDRRRVLVAQLDAL